MPKLIILGGQSNHTFRKASLQKIHNDINFSIHCPLSILMRYS